MLECTIALKDNTNNISFKREELPSLFPNWYKKNIYKRVNNYSHKAYAGVGHDSLKNSQSANQDNNKSSEDSKNRFK